MTVVTQVGCDPDEVWDCAGHVVVELGERNDLVWAGRTVIRKWIVLQRVWVCAFRAAARHSFHVGAPRDAGRGELRAQASGGERVPPVVADAPGASRGECEVVGQARVRDAVVVGCDRILRGELGGVAAGDRLGVAAVLHDDQEDVRGVGVRCG